MCYKLHSEENKNATVFMESNVICIDFQTSLVQCVLLKGHRYHFSHAVERTIKQICCSFFSLFFPISFLSSCSACPSQYKHTTAHGLYCPCA